MEVARLLHDEGAAVDAQSKKGMTALMMALPRRPVEMARLLLEKGADRTLPTPLGPPLLEVLDRFGHPEEKVAELRARALAMIASSTSRSRLADAWRTNCASCAGALRR